MGVFLDSGQHWLDRNRPPRVQITYDLETGGAIEKKELPLVVGIIADLCVRNAQGQDGLPLPALKERKFIQIDRDNFNEVLKKINPVLELKGVENKLRPGEKGLTVKMAIAHIDDFHPAAVVEKAEFPTSSGSQRLLKELMGIRQQLVNLIARIDGNDALYNAILGLKSQLQGVVGGANKLMELADPDTSPDKKKALVAELSLKVDPAEKTKLEDLLKLTDEAQRKTQADDLGKAMTPEQRKLLGELLQETDGARKQALITRLASKEDAGQKAKLEKLASEADAAERAKLLQEQLKPVTDSQAEFSKQVEEFLKNPDTSALPPDSDTSPAAMMKRVYGARLVRDLEDKEQRDSAGVMVGTFVQEFLKTAQDYVAEQRELVRREREKYDLKDPVQARKWKLFEEEHKKKLESDVLAALNHRLALIDLRLGHQLDAIFHHPDFQKLESSWRGLHYLVMRSETGTHLKLRVLHASQKELLDDLDKAADFDQSTLFKKVYEEEYGTFGGHPFSLLIGDYHFSSHPQDVKLLQLISNVAAAAHAPFISAAHWKLFGLEDFTRLDAPRDLAKLFDSSDYITWRSFRDSEDSRYVTLTLPRFLLRLPYGRDTVPVEGFDYNESVATGLNPKAPTSPATAQHAHHAYLWGNSAYALGARITDAFARYRWCAAIRGVENGGRVNDLPIHLFKAPEGEKVVKIPTEASITDRREKELSDLGFLPLCYRKADNYAVFFGSQTVQKPRVFDTPQATANASISAQLPYMLAASRFAHYLKVIMRDKIGSYMTRDGAAAFLNRWISAYVQLNDEAAPDIKARQPLREARIDVFDLPGKPGCFRSVVFLRPHFQLNELTASIRLVAELPKPAA